ncbi:hypothetical protein FQN57_005909 [Myotisia sp. PD_48]|nr:hypothetical protein FQN57_005909 [Myotisia sp. PD_48]
MDYPFVPSHANPQTHSNAAINISNHRSLSPSSSSTFGSLFAPNLSPPPSHSDQPLNVQTRRLQLRNAGFRGTLLQAAPIREANPQFETWGGVPGSVGADENKEDNCGTGISYDSYQPEINRRTSPQKRRSSSILREISTSNRRRESNSSSSSTGSIFKGSPSRAAQSTFPFPSLRNSPEPQPSHSDWETAEEMGEGVQSIRGSFSRKSSLASLERIKRLSGKGRDGRRDTSAYIEHLENQLAASMHDSEMPDSSVYLARYKALSAEHRALKQELVEWEERFEARVEEETFAMLQKDSQSKSKLRALERELETKDNRIRELEWEVEMDAHKLRSLEAIKSTNRSLERRVDVLTGLLAQSPTRADLDTAIPISAESPGGEGSHRTPRPKSMFTKIPLSPVRQPIIQPLTIPEPNSMPLSSTEYPKAAEAPDDDKATETSDESLVANDCDLQTGATDAVAFPEFPSTDSGIGDSCSPPSTRAPGSQRDSFISHSAHSSISTTAFPLSPDFQSKLRYRQRKMRRFPSGSCSLKPFVLPVASAVLAPPYLPSSPIQTIRDSRRYSTAHSRSSSNFDDSFLYTEELQYKRRDTLNSLEGNTRKYQSFEEAMAGHDLSEVPDEEETFVAALDVDLADPGTNLRKVFDLPRTESDIDIEPCKRDISRRYGDLIQHNTDTVIIRGRNQGLYRDVSSRIHSGNWPRAANSNRGSSSDKKGEESWLQRFNISRFLASSRCIARYIFSNSWHSNWKRLGSISWWFLGIVLGPQIRNNCFERFAYKAISEPGVRLSPETSPLGHPGSPSFTMSSSRGTRLSTHESALSSKARSYSSASHTVGSKPSESAFAQFARNPANTVQLWVRFSVTLVLAIGFAVKDGPASLMCECPLEHATNLPEPSTRGKSSQIDYDSPYLSPE